MAMQKVQAIIIIYILYPLYNIHQYNIVSLYYILELVLGLSCSYGSELYMKISLSPYSIDNMLLWCIIRVCNLFRVNFEMF